MHSVKVASCSITTYQHMYATHSLTNSNQFRTPLMY